MTRCLCTHTEADHASGTGACRCRCPGYRPCQEYGTEHEAHDLAHDAAISAFLAEHTPAETREREGQAVWLGLTYRVPPGDEDKEP